MSAVEIHYRDANGVVRTWEAVERVNRDLGTLTVVITHNAVMAEMADRVIHFSDGRVHHEHRNAKRAAPSSLNW